MAWLQSLKHLVQIVGWVQRGMPIPPVPAVKRRLLLAMLEKHKLSIFVETGTFKGDTLAFMAGYAERAVSIELSPEYFARAKARFASTQNIELHQGDSGVKLPEIMNNLTKPALFWLDGHYSAGKTAQGDLDSPISAELNCILDSPIKGHIILIDDAHDFTEQGGYPELGRFLTGIATDGRYHAYVHANVIVLEPNRGHVSQLG